MYGPFQVWANLNEILPRWEVRTKSLQPIGKLLYSVFIVSIQSISRLYICVIVGSRYINSCPYIRALSIDSPEIQSVLYLQLIRIERSLWIRIQISPAEFQATGGENISYLIIAKVIARYVELYL